VLPAAIAVRLAWQWLSLLLPDVLSRAVMGSLSARFAAGSG